MTSSVSISHLKKKKIFFIWMLLTLAHLFIWYYYVRSVNTILQLKTNRIPDEGQQLVFTILFLICSLLLDSIESVTVERFLRVYSPATEFTCKPTYNFCVPTLRLGKNCYWFFYYISCIILLHFSSLEITLFTLYLKPEWWRSKGILKINLKKTMLWFSRSQLVPHSFVLSFLSWLLCT